MAFCRHSWLSGRSSSFLDPIRNAVTGKRQTPRLASANSSSPMALPALRAPSGCTAQRTGRASIRTRTLRLANASESLRNAVIGRIRTTSAARASRKRPRLSSPNTATTWLNCADLCKTPSPRMAFSFHNVSARGIFKKLEASHSGLVRTLGKRVRGNPPRVRISPPPPSTGTACDLI
jgi:hypothetical protein